TPQHAFGCPTLLSDNHVRRGWWGKKIDPFKTFLSSMVHRWSSVSFFQEGDMATIDVRKGPDGKVAYRARVRRKGYATHTAPFTTRAEAKKWITITEGAIFEQRHFPAKASTQRTLGDMIERYLREILP